MSVEAILGVVVTLLVFIMGGLVHLVWMLSGFKGSISSHASQLASQWTKHGEHEAAFIQVRHELGEHDGRLKVVESHL